MASKTMVSTTIASLGTSLTPLNREGSIYNITLDELQNSLIESGKNFGSMSMDEFLKNISPSEEGYTVQGNVHTESDPDRLFHSNFQQGSLMLPGTLSRKNVDEVWKEIQGQKEQERYEKQQQYLQEQQHHHKNQQQQQGPGNFKEMTLENFLVKAGIVRDAAEGGPPASTATGTSFGSTFGAVLQTPQADVENITQNHQQLEWYKYQFKQQQQKQHQFLLQQQAEAAAAAIAGTAKRTGPVGGMLLCGNALEAPLDIGPGLAPGNLLTNRPLSPCLATPEAASKRRDFDVVERTVERRQRRMIKNRESAARSRARKQAYTMELETEVMQLKEENLRLKRQRVAKTFGATQELMGSARVLRRTRSAPW